VTAPAVDLATRYAAVPPELTACPQWVVWRREARDGRPTKVPYCAVVPRRRASSTDAATWAPFEVAADALGADPTLDGVGFVVTPALGVVGVDVDGCLTANGPDDTARAILDALPGTYCERSPSGRGLRPLRARHAAAGGNRRGPVEMYAAGRFLTITGSASRTRRPSSRRTRRGSMRCTRGSSRSRCRTRGRPLSPSSLKARAHRRRRRGCMTPTVR
jgi:putative DNA primase/helicase